MCVSHLTLVFMCPRSLWAEPPPAASSARGPHWCASACNCSLHTRLPILLPPLQPVGCTTPGSKLLIEKRDVKGVVSSGMLCSAHDIGWSKEIDGVLVVLAEELDAGAACPEKAPKVSKGG